MKTTCCALALLFSLTFFVGQSSAATVSLAAKTSWGGGDGWLAPGEGGYAYLGTGNNERGLAYGNGHVYLTSRATVASVATNVRILNQNTGADVGALDTTGVTGGTFTVNTAAVGTDGAIYVNNLTTQSTTTPFKVYRWATEASLPTVAYTGDGGLAASRIGDSMALIGGGASTRLALGYNSTPVVAGNNGYAIIDPTASTATAVGFVGTPPNAGDFRLGITFSDATHVLGTAGSSLYRYTSFAGSAGTLIGSPAIPDPAGATADRLLAVTTINGLPLLAVQSIGDSHVSIYDVTDPGTPLYRVSGNNTTGALTANGNGVGQLAWGATVTNGLSVTQTLYAMSVNQGIQAFDVTVTVPEPTTFAAALVGLAACVAGRQRRRIA